MKQHAKTIEIVLKALYTMWIVIPELIVVFGRTCYCLFKNLQNKNSGWATFHSNISLLDNNLAWILHSSRTGFPQTQICPMGDLLKEYRGVAGDATNAHLDQRLQHGHRATKIIIPRALLLLVIHVMQKCLLLGWESIPTPANQQQATKDDYQQSIEISSLSFNTRSTEALARMLQV